MRVLYDISVLGYGHRFVRARTGIFRVVETVAAGLSRSPEVALGLCACDGAPDAMAYLGAPGPLVGLPFEISGPRGAAARRVGALTAAVEMAAPLKRTALKVARKPWQWALQGWNATVGPVPREALGRYDLYHTPFFPVPGLLRGAGRPRCLLTVYDLIPIRHPDYFSGGEAATVRRALARIRPEDWTLCISEATRRDLLEFRSDLDPGRVVVTPLAAAAHFRPCPDPAERTRVREKYGLPEAPYILSLCTLEPRKNIEGVVAAFGRLAGRGALGDAHLVLAGTAGWKYGAVTESLERLGGLRDRVTVTGFVDDGDLSALYSGATMFIYPSRYEGFGLPVLEAMQCGVPTITSDNSSLPEVVGEAGLMVPAEDGEALDAAVLRLWDDGALRSELGRRALARAATFSWGRTVEATVAVYRKALEG